MSREKVIKTESHVHRFMYGLGIKGSTLQVYAALYSFTLGERGLFHGSIAYLAASLMISERTVNRAYKRLRELGLIEDYESRDGRCMTNKQDQNQRSYHRSTNATNIRWHRSASRKCY